MRKVWIEAALNGAWSRALQPGIPDTVEAIIACRLRPPSPFVTQLRTSTHAIAKSEGQSPGLRATTDMLERYAISFPNVTS